MQQDKFNQWINLMAAETLAALTAARSQNTKITEATLARALSQREKWLDLIKEAGQENLWGPEINKDLKNNELQFKYNEALDTLRHVETRSQDLEDAFKGLVNILASLAKNKKYPDLNTQLVQLKGNLKKKAAVSRINSTAKSLKEFLFRLDDTPEEPAEPEVKKGGMFRRLLKGGADPLEVKGEKSAVGRPEDIEENIRDILMLLVLKITEFEDDAVQRKARFLVKKINDDFTIEEYKDYLLEIQELILSVKETVHRQKRELIRFSREVMSRLEETENDLLRTLETGARHLAGPEKDFLRQVTGDIKYIEESLDDRQIDLEEMRGLVLEKITAIRERFHKKQAEDEARLRQIEAEKCGFENRLKDIHRRYKDFTRKSQEMLQEMEKFRQASLKDSLTGIYNRRAYDAQMAKALEEYQKGNLTKLTLIVFDIDYFKDFNTKFGHRAGDMVLSHVAKLTKSALRREDFVARYGGDEFVVILPEAALKDAARIADKIRAGIYGVEFKIYKDDDLSVQIGLSLGVADARSGDDAASIFERADQALYQAKERGRNQVVTAE